MSDKIFITLFIFFIMPLIILAQAPDPAKLSYNRAIQFAVDGDFSLARSAFQETLGIDSLYIPAKLNLTVIDDVDSLKIDKTAALHYFRAIELGNRDSLSAKIEQLDKAIQGSPDFGLAYNERGISWAKIMEYEEAIANYDQAILYLPESPEIYFNKALSCDNIEKFTDAQSAYLKFLEYTPQDYLWYIIYARKRIHEINQLNAQE